MFDFNLQLFKWIWLDASYFLENFLNKLFGGLFRFLQQYFFEMIYFEILFL